jgi:hypothetical protein
MGNLARTRLQRIIARIRDYDKKEARVKSQQGGGIIPCSL